MVVWSREGFFRESGVEVVVEEEVVREEATGRGRVGWEDIVVVVWWVGKDGGKGWRDG